MAVIKIQGGLERDDFEDASGNVIGVAEYDLNDSGVRLRVLEFADGIEARLDKFILQIESIPNETFEHFKMQSRAEVEFVEKLIVDIDDIFGLGFCAKAVGANCRNYLTLLEVLEGIITKYGAHPNMQMDRFVNGNKNREQKRIQKHGTGQGNGRK